MIEWLGAARHGIDVIELAGRTRNGRSVLPLIREFFQVSNPTIGEVAQLRISQGVLFSRVDARRIAIYALGISTPAAALEMLRGYRDTESDARWNGWQATAANDVIQQVGPAFMGIVRPEDEVWMFGHSYGGVLIEVLASLIQASATHRVIRSHITYGMPKPGQRPPWAGIAGDRVRLVSAGDPIPALPVSAHGSRRTIALALSSAAYVASGWHFPCSATRLTTIFPPIRSADEVWSATDLRDALAEFQRGDDLVDRHSAAWYQILLNIREKPAFVTGPGEQQLPPPPATSGRERSVPQVHRLDVALPPGFFAPGLTAEMADVRPSGIVSSRTDFVGRILNGDRMARSKIAPESRFKFSKVGPTYAVSYDDLIVARANTASRAKTMASKMTAILAVGGSMASWDIPTMLQAWQLAAGKAVAGQGVTPPWVAG